MSFYVLIGAAVLEVIGVALITSAALVLRVRSNQQTNASDKRSLLVASVFMGLSIVFLIFSMISLFITMTKGKCKKGSAIPLIIFFSLAAISLIIAIVITQIFLARRKREGDTNSVRDFRAVSILPLIAIGLMTIGFILIFVIVGRKIKRVTKMCQKAVNIKSQIPISQ